MDEISDATPQPASTDRLRDDVIAVLRTCYDPEIPADIYEMGLIYDVAIEAEGRVKIKMTLTSPACPVAGTLPGEVETKVREVEGVSAAEIELVWEPSWTPERMSDAAKLKLGFF